MTMSSNARRVFNLTAWTTEVTARSATEEEGGREEREEGESDEGSLSEPQSREGSLSPPRDHGLSSVDETKPQGEINKLHRKLGVTREEGKEESGEENDKVRLPPPPPTHTPPQLHWRCPPAFHRKAARKRKRKRRRRRRRRRAKQGVRSQMRCRVMVGPITDHGR
jgi:hypothetical protein